MRWDIVELLLYLITITIMINNRKVEVEEVEVSIIFHLLELESVVQIVGTLLLQIRLSL